MSKNLGSGFSSNYSALALSSIIGAETRQMLVTRGFIARIEKWAEAKNRQSNTEDHFMHYIGIYLSEPK